MFRKIGIFFFLAAVLIFFLVGTGYGNDKSAELKKETELLADEILSRMTEEEKIGQVLHIAIPAKNLDTIGIQEIQKIKPGGIILFGMNFGAKEEIQKLTSDLQNLASIEKILPFLISTDQEGGRVVRVQSVQEFPGAMAIGQVGVETYSERVGFFTSYQLKEHGINIFFAPVLDINNNPDNPVINTRSFGSDLETVLKMSEGFQRGAMDGGAIPVIKHFPGHGDTNIDSHLGLPVIQKSQEELFQMELVPFQKSIENGIRAVMSAHIVFPKLDPDLPATLSPKILNKVLRDRFKFRGVIFTDAMEMKAISENYLDKKPGKLAILAGADIVLLTSWGKVSSDYKLMLEEAVKEKAFDVNGKNVLNEAVKRQIILKLENGIIPLNMYKSPKELLEKYLFEKKENSKKKYSEYIKKESPKKLNQILSRKSIRSYEKKFTPLTEKEISKTEFYVKNPFLKSILKEMKLKEVKLSKKRQILYRLKKSKIVLASEKLEDIEEIKKFILKNPNKNIILLHFGSPFLEFPKSKNLQILFSFSPTEESLRALANSLSFKYSKNAIATPNLILKNNPK
ncbi:MAG: beta-glucosidase [Leptospiraceae bacterium]|nr:beta-glucosidase [Leptospiraceae bacterium]NUM40097.1 beta-glucosidase [Leptospiraceae bacterium]